MTTLSHTSRNVKWGKRDQKSEKRKYRIEKKVQNNLKGGIEGKAKTGQYIPYKYN